MKKNRLPYGEAGFKVPDAYFENFEARMMSQVAPKEDHSKENPFKVPDQYFEQLEERVFNKLEETRPKSKVIPIFNRRTWSYVASVAAVLAVLLSSIVLDSTTELNFNDLDLLAVEDYLLEHLEPEKANHAAAETYEFSAMANPNIDKEALFEYLNDHIEEPALLLNED